MRAMWKVKQTLELVRVDVKGRVTGGGFQGFWLVGDSRGQMVRTLAVGGPQAGGAAAASEQRSGLQTHTEEVGLQMGKQMKGEAETTVIYKSRTCKFKAAWEDMVVVVGEGVTEPAPRSAPLGGMEAETCKYTSTHNLNTES